MNSFVKSKVVQHLQKCTNSMIEEENLYDKCQCLNIASELISSVLFYDDDKQLQALHFSLNVIHSTVMEILQSDTNIKINYFIKMAEYLNLISDRIETESEYNTILSDMMSLTFSITSFGAFFY